MDLLTERPRLYLLLRPIVALSLAILLSGCAALQSVAALSQVRFALDGVSSVRLAGVDMTEVRELGDLSALDALRLGQSLANRRAPVELILDVAGDNPEDNPEARLVGLDWTFFLEDQERVSGGLPSPITLPTGQRTTIPLQVNFDLVDLADEGLRDVIELTAALAGLTDRRPDVRLEALPTVETRIGPLQYPRPLVLRPS